VIHSEITSEYNTALRGLLVPSTFTGGHLL